MDSGGVELDIIVNPKVADDGTPVIQLETAVGAAIKHFKNAHGINVPRSRFLPVSLHSMYPIIGHPIIAFCQSGQVMLRLITDHLGFILAPTRQIGDEPRPHVQSDSCHQARRYVQEDCQLPETLPHHP